jgi:tetratricopeptide (TPR) repeat protein
MNTELQRNLTKRLLRFRSLPDKEDPISLAEDLLKTGRYGDARGVVVSAQKGKAEDATLFLLEARAWFLERDLARAQAALLEAIRTDPECAQAYTLLGEVMLKRGEPERAVKALNRALAIDPKDDRTTRLCGRALRFSDIARSYSDSEELRPAGEAPSGDLSLNAPSPTPMVPPAPKVAPTPVIEPLSLSVPDEPEGLAEPPRGAEGNERDEPFSDRPTALMIDDASIRASVRPAIAPPERPSGPARPIPSIYPVSDKPDQEGKPALSAPAPSATIDEDSFSKSVHGGKRLMIFAVALVVLAFLVAVGIYLAHLGSFQGKRVNVLSPLPVPGKTEKQTAAMSSAEPATAPSSLDARPETTSEAAAAMALLDTIEQLARESRFSEARAYLSSVPQPVRQSALGRAATARLALAQGRAVEALNALRALAQEEPLSPPVSVIYGNALLVVGRVDEAAAAYNSALKLDPEMPEALLERAQLAVRGEQVVNAFEFLDRAERSPKTAARPEAFHARLLTIKGRAYILRAQPGDFELACRFLFEAIAKKGVPVEAYFWLGEAQAPRKPLAASMAFQRYLDLDPKGIFAARAKRALLPR